VYQADSGVDYQVYVPDDFATAIGMIPGTTQPGLPSQISPRYGSFNGSDGSSRQVVIQNQSLFATIIGSVYVVGGVTFTCVGAQGQIIPPYQSTPLNGAAMVQGPAGTPGSAGPPGPPGPPGPGGLASQLISTIYNTILLAADAVALLITGPTVAGSSNLFEIRRGSDSYLGFSVSSDSTSTTCYNLFVNNDLYTGATANFIQNVTFGARLYLQNAQSCLQFPLGANMTFGSGTLSGGTATISNTAVSPYSRAMVWNTDSAPASTAGILAASNFVSGTGFTVNSSNPSDTANFDYMLFWAA